MVHKDNRCWGIFFLISAFILPLTAFAEDKCDAFDGTCWNSLEKYEKVIALMAFTQGKAAGYIQGKIIKETIITYIERDRFSLPDSTTYNDVIQYVDKLYSFPVNRNIVFTKAMLLAALYLRDDDDNDRVNLLRLYRDGKQLPFLGKIKKILSPNRLILSTDKDGEFEVVFPRTSVKKMDEEIKADALNFLTVMSTASNSEDACDESQAYVEINYPMDFFAEDGALRAELTISGNNVCIAGQSTSLSDLSQNSNNQWLLGMQLLRNGLVNYDKNNDPKWSKSLTMGAIIYDIVGDNEDKKKNELVQLIDSKLSH